MKKNISIRHCISGVFIALLILVQSVIAAGLPAPYTHEEHASTHKTEVKQEITAKTSYVVSDTRIMVVAFLFSWLSKVFTLDVPLIAYYNCDAFSINPYFFNIFYTCLSALAP